MVLFGCHVDRFLTPAQLCQTGNFLLMQFCSVLSALLSLMKKDHSSWIGDRKLVKLCVYFILQKLVLSFSRHSCLRAIFFPYPLKILNSRCQLCQNIFLVQTLQEPKNTRHLQPEALPSAGIQNKAEMWLCCMAPLNLRTNLQNFLAKSPELHTSAWHTSLKLLHRGISNPVILGSE